MKKILAVALLASTVATPALAADQGFYANADAGQVSFTGNATSFPKPHSITLGGGYHFNQYVGVETGYSIVGDSTIDTVIAGVSSSTESLKTKILQVAAVGTYPINDKFELFGKLGLANDKFDDTYSYSAPGNSYSTTISTSKTNLMFGIGGQYNITRQFGIRVQYQDFGKATFSGCTGNCDIGAKYVSAGGVYNF